MAARHTRQRGPAESVDALLAPASRATTSWRATTVKARLLGLSELADYDRYAPPAAAEGQRSSPRRGGS